MSATPHSDKSLTEMVETLTGHEELAIARTFEANLGDLLANFTNMGRRALIMVDRSRVEGTSAEAAKSFALGMTLKDVQAYFATGDDDEIDPDDPESPAGKDDSLPD